MRHKTSEMRGLWKSYECAKEKMVTVEFGPDKIRVAPPTAPAWRALAAVLAHHSYKIRVSDTDSYNCRNIKGSTEKSLHSFGIALDVNWETNPWRDHAGSREVRFSNGRTQEERAEDVKLGRADTDMTPIMIQDISRIKTLNGKQVFEWGGNWGTVKDCMHFELDVSPEDLSEGIDPSTVAGWSGYDHSAPLSLQPPPNMGSGSSKRYVVIARRGLNLRGGASIDFPILQNLPTGTELYVIGRSSEWAQVDLHGDNLADGYVAFQYLRLAPASGDIGVATA